MTAPYGIGAVGTQAATGGYGAAGSSALGGMDSEAFLKLLVAQMRYQNPLSPSDPSDMMLQTAQLTQLETIQQLATLQRRDLGLQEAVLAAGMVGSEISAPAADGTTVTGTVDGVRYTVAGPVLDVGGTDVPLGDVTEVRRAGAPSA